MSYTLSAVFFDLKTDYNMSCTEQNFALIGKIEAFGLDELTTTFNRYLPKRTVRSGEVTMRDDKVVPAVVPLHPKSARLAETTVSGRGGMGYEVSLTWQVHRASEADIAVLEDMKYNAKHLKITAFGDAVGYILADKDHYRMDYQRNGELIECSVKVSSVNGLQQLV